MVLVLQCFEWAFIVFKIVINYDNYSSVGFWFNMMSWNVLLLVFWLMINSVVVENYRFQLNYLKYLDEVQVVVWVMDV